MKAKVWCEVSCGYCERAVGFDYVNAKTISNLKKITSKWEFHKTMGNMCPDCANKYKQGKNLY